MDETTKEKDPSCCNCCENCNECTEKTGDAKKGLKAKTVSLIGKIIGGIIVIGGYALKVTDICPNIEVDDLRKIAVSIMVLISTIDLNIAIDKFAKEEN